MFCVGRWKIQECTQNISALAITFMVGSADFVAGRCSTWRTSKCRLHGRRRTSLVPISLLQGLADFDVSILWPALGQRCDEVRSSCTAPPLEAPLLCWPFTPHDRLSAAISARFSSARAPGTASAPAAAIPVLPVAPPETWQCRFKLDGAHGSDLFWGGSSVLSFFPCKGPGE